MINADNIFSLFDDNKDERFEGDINYFSQAQLLFCLGMFTKLIGNIKGFSVKTDESLKKLKLTKEIENEIKNKSEYYVYDKALFFLNQIDLSEKYHRDSVSIGVNSDSILALTTCLNFFESREDYEKCAILHQYEKFFHLSLARKD